jgi:hypothetical protein
MAKNISESEFNPNIHVKEYKRKCNQCGKVWHTLAEREKEIERNMKNNNFQILGNCCNPSAQLQAKRNVEAGGSELNNLKKCPYCGSSDYSESVHIYEKK